MAQSTNNATNVVKTEKYKVIYERKHFLIFTWYKKLKADKLGQDLEIATQEDFDGIYLNGEKLK